MDSIMTSDPHCMQNPVVHLFIMEKFACSHLLPRIVAWGPVHNNIAFRHWILNRELKYH